MFLLGFVCLLLVIKKSTVSFGLLREKRQEYVTQLPQTIELRERDDECNVDVQEWGKK